LDADAEEPDTADKPYSEDVRSCLLENCQNAKDSGAESTRFQFACSVAAGAVLAFVLVGGVGLWHFQQTHGSEKSPFLMRGPLLHPAEAGDPDVHSLTLLTAETRGKSLLECVGDFAAGFAVPVINVGLGKDWYSFKTKVEMLRDYVSGLKLSREAQGKSNKDHFVAFFDGKDVFWGGCSPADFMAAYHRIVDASGARIVFGAEIVCGEQDCNRVPPVPRWAHDLAGGRDLEGGFWDLYNEGCHGTWSDECAARRDCGFAAPCAEPPAVKFLNSGFFMGPVDEVAAMMEWSLANYDNTSVYGDQSVFSKWWELHPDKLTLDYLGELSLQLSDLDWSLLTADRRTGIVWNTGFDRVQCLIHGNGRGSFFAAHLLRHLTGGFDQKDLLGWQSHA